MLFGLGVLAASGPAEAALSVSPLRVVHRAKPRQTVTGAFTLANRGEDPLDVKVEPEDWSGGAFGDRTPARWVIVRPARLILAPGKTAKVSYTVRVPKDAAGELRAQVFFTTEQSGPGAMPMRSRLGTVIYIGIEGTQRIDAAITRVHASSTPDVAKPDRLDVVIGIQNTSNVHIAPDGQVAVRDAQGTQVAQLTIQGGWGLLPNEEDRYHAIGHGVYLLPGRYSLEIAVRCGHDLGQPTTITRHVAIEVNEAGRIRVLDGAAPEHP